MSLEFIYGKVTADLKKECVNNIKIMLEDKEIEQILIISSEQYKKEIEVEIRTSNVIDSQLKIKITTIREFCAELINSYGDKRLRNLNNNQKIAVITYILNSVKGELEIYQNLINNETFIKLLITTIESIKQEGLTPTDFNEIIKKVNNTITKEKLQDIKTIYTAYENFIKDRFLDEQDKLIYANTLVKSINKINRNILMYKVEELNSLEIDLIKSLTCPETNVTVAVTTDNIHREPSNLSGAFFKTDLLIRNLKIELAHLGTTNKGAIYIESDFKSKEIQHLDENLYKYPYNEVCNETVDIFSAECNTIQDEIENLVKNIEVLRGKGTDLNTISVASANMSQYERKLRTLFKQYNIPFNFKRTIEFSHHPLLKLIDSLLKLNDNLSKKDFIRFLKIGYSPIPPKDINILESYLKSDTASDIFDCNSIDEVDLVGKKFNSINELIELSECLYELFNSWNTEKSFDSFYQGLFKFFEKSNILNKLRSDIKNELEESKESTTASTWENVIRNLDSTSKVLADLDLEFKTFESILLHIFSNLKSTEQIGTNGVSIIPLDRLEVGTKEIIFMLGVNDGVFPRKPGDTTLLTDNDISELNSLGIFNHKDSISKVLLEQFNTYKCLVSSDKMLFISYSVVGNDLSTMKKSPIISRLNQLFPKLSSNVPIQDIMSQDMLFIEKSNLKNFNHINEIIQQYNMLDDNNKALTLKSLEELKEVSIYKDYISNAVKALAYNNTVELTDKYTLQSLYYSDTLSVSKLEKYAKCPFAYFIEYGLKIKEEESKKLKAKDIGIAVHSIIEQFEVRLKKKNLNWEHIDDTYTVTEIDAIMKYIEKRSSMNVFESTEASKYYKKKIKELAITTITALKYHIGNSFFESVGHEINFGDRGKFPPITIKLPSGKRLKLRGQIDRLDELKIGEQKYVRIVDYKTGNKILDFTEILHGTQLQLLTYLDAIVNSKEGEYLPAGVFYFKVDDPYVKATPNIDDSYILENKLKELRMKGLFIDRRDIVQLMDKGIYDGDYKTSLNIQAKFKTDGMLSKSTSGISMEDLDILREFTKENIKDLSNKMLVEGNIEITPIKKKSIEACTYCKYKGICQFDESLSFNDFKYLPELSKDEVIDIAYKKVRRRNE